MPRARAAAQQEVSRESLMASAAAADLVRAAERFLEIGANAFMSHGAGLVGEATVRGCKFALRIMLPDGRVRVDVVTAEGEAVRLLEVASNEAARTV